ncbi:hypothetical protein MKEN_01498200 [Mycena kentingensis (nom. inval.)]|nr:hypothetical protein MKEN_01498200 [Mycena kentingensis (nom. inval.)]
MTEYDFSIEAISAHLENQMRVARWTETSAMAGAQHVGGFEPPTPMVFQEKELRGERRKSRDDEEEDGERRSRRHSGERDRRRHRERERTPPPPLPLLPGRAPTPHPHGHKRSKSLGAQPLRSRTAPPPGTVYGQPGHTTPPAQPSPYYPAPPYYAQAPPVPALPQPHQPVPIRVPTIRPRAAPTHPPPHHVLRPRALPTREPRPTARTTPHVRPRAIPASATRPSPGSASYVRAGCARSTIFTPCVADDTVPSRPEGALAAQARLRSWWEWRRRPTQEPATERDLLENRPCVHGACRPSSCNASASRVQQESSPSLHPSLGLAGQPSSRRLFGLPHSVFRYDHISLRDKAWPCPRPTTPRFDFSVCLQKYLPDHNIE